MPCSMIRLADGTVCYVKHSAPRRQKCRFCARWSTKLCDFPMGNGKTCNAPCCSEHSVSVGEDRDFCEAHRKAAPQKSLFEGAA